MKTLYTIISIALAMSCGGTALQAKPQGYKGENLAVENLKNFKGTGSFHNQTIRVDATKGIPTRAESTFRTEVITEVPGAPQIYAKECGGTTVNWLYGVMIYENTYPAEIVWDGDNVYFANIIRNAPYYGTTYVKGEKSGNKISVPVPQTVMWYDDEQYGYNLVLLKLNPKASSDGNTYIYDDKITSFDYLINEDGSIEMALPGGFDGENLPEYVLGLIFTDIDPDYDNTWFGFCDIYQTYVPFTETTLEMPENIEASNYTLAIDEFGYPVSVAFQGETVFFKGMGQDMPEGVIQGTISGQDPFTGYQIIDIPQNQYVGIYNDETFVYTKSVYINPKFDPDDPDSIYLLLAPDSQPFQLYYNAEAQIFVPANTSYYLCFNSGKDRVSFINLLDNFEMFRQDDYYGVPANPHSLAFDDTIADLYGYFAFYFNIPAISTQGTLLDTDDLYYSIFIDDVPLEFVEEEIVALNDYESLVYWNVAEATDRLPVSFDNMWDITKYSETSYKIGIYMEGITTIGVQSYYTYGNKLTESDLVTLNLETGEETSITGVKGIQTGAEIINTEYFNLNGRKVMNPSNGIFIKKITLSDGKSLVKKIALK